MTSYEKELNLPNLPPDIIRMIIAMEKPESIDAICLVRLYFQVIYLTIFRNSVSEIIYHGGIIVFFLI